MWSKANKIANCLFTGIKQPFSKGGLSPEKIKELSQRYSKAKSAPSSVSNQVGLILCGTAVGIHVLWQVLPYNQMFAHFSLNEYIYQRHYYHATLLQGLSFPTRGNMLVYFPLLLASAALSRRLFSNR